MKWVKIATVLLLNMLSPLIGWVILFAGYCLGMDKGIIGLGIILMGAMTIGMWVYMIWFWFRFFRSI